MLDRLFVAVRNFLLEWIALNGGDAGQSQTYSAAMTHGMVRIRLFLNTGRRLPASGGATKKSRRMRSSLVEVCIGN